MKVIITADDYGAVDCVDSAIIKAIRAKKINSVAIFPNARDFDERVAKLLQVKAEVETADFKIDLGCHLTFCTGAPLSQAPTPNFVEGGFFKPFTKTQRAHKDDRGEELKFVRTEIRTQIKRLEDAGVDVSHLTCHHNTLFWFADYFDELTTIAGDYNGRKIPLRSPIFNPLKRYRTYKNFAMPLKNKFFFLRGGRTRRLYKEWRKNYLTDVHIVMDRNDVVGPEVTYNGHYGPLPGSNAGRIDIEKRGPKLKHKKLDKFFRKEKDRYDKVEIMLHLVEGEFSKLESINQQFKAFERGDLNAYPGMNPKYIYGRMTEMNSIMSYELPNGVKMGLWEPATA